MRKLTFLCLVLFAVSLFGCKQKSEEGVIRIIHAGSLSMIVKEAIDSFQMLYPGVTFLTESWGSKDGARQITELGKSYDIFLSADEAVISSFLIPDHASWSAPFAGNELVLAYTPKSKYNTELNGNNWYEILGRSDVYTARSSPDADPCGVRAVLMLMLCDNYYGNSTISQKLLSKDHKFIRPKEVDLIAMLEKQVVDYLYIYKSIAVQHKFLYQELPDEINLSNPFLRSVYSGVSFATAGKTPGSEHIEVGAPIVYGLTIPKSAANRDGAIEFLKFLLDINRGGKIIERNGQNFLFDIQKINTDNIPSELVNYFKNDK